MQTTYWTYDGYLDEAARQEIHYTKRMLVHCVNSSIYFAAFGAFVVLVPAPS